MNLCRLPIEAARIIMWILRAGLLTMVVVAVGSCNSAERPHTEAVKQSASKAPTNLPPVDQAPRRIATH